MKSKLLTLGVVTLMIVVNAGSQTTPGGTVPGGAGVQVPPPIPPNGNQQSDYIRRRELHSADATQIQAGTNQIIAVSTNLSGVGTNPFAGGAINPTNLAPTSEPGATNRFYGTNSWSATNNTSATMQDQALTALDQSLLLRIRQSSPKLSPNGQWSTVNFQARNGVITTVGTVNSVEEDKEIVSTVQAVPGVVRVNDQLSVSARQRQGVATGAAATSEAAGATGASVESSAASNTVQQGVTTTTSQTGPVSNKVNTGFTTQTSPYTTRPSGYYTSSVSTATAATNQAVPGQAVPGAGAVVAPTSNPNVTNRIYNNPAVPGQPR